MKNKQASSSKPVSRCGHRITPVSPDNISHWFIPFYYLKTWKCILRVFSSHRIFQWGTSANIVHVSEFSGDVGGFESSGEIYLVKWNRVDDPGPRGKNFSSRKDESVLLNTERCNYGFVQTGKKKRLIFLWDIEIGELCCEEALTLILVNGSPCLFLFVSIKRGITSWGLL